MNTSPELGPIKIVSLAEGDSVSWLQIQNRETGEIITLKKEESGWIMKFPVSYPAESFLVKGMISALTLAPRLRRFPFKGKALRDFGLDSPKMKISIETEKGNQRSNLLLGELSPVGGGVYARWEGEGEYFLIPPDVKASFERSVYSLRQKKLFFLDWDDVTEVHLKAGPKEYRLEKQGEVWRGFLPPGTIEIPLEKATDLIYAFQSLYIKDFLDGKNPSKNEFQLRDKKDFLGVGRKEGATEKVFLGARANEKDAVYALREKENLVLLISWPNIESLLEKFETTFQEAGKNANSGKSSTDPGTDSKGVSAGPQKLSRSETRPRNQNRAGEPATGSV